MSIKSVTTFVHKSTNAFIKNLNNDDTIKATPFFSVFIYSILPGKCSA